MLFLGLKPGQSRESIPKYAQNGDVTMDNMFEANSVLCPVAALTGSDVVPEDGMVEFGISATVQADDPIELLLRVDGQEQQITRPLCTDRCLTLPVLCSAGS
jgi:hypothetical protein